MWSVNLICDEESVEAGNLKYDFHYVQNEQFDLVHSHIGDSTNGVLYCAESQWDEVNAYYGDTDNFTYYCCIGRENLYNDDYPITIATPEIDTEKFDQLLAFAEKNRTFVLCD